MKKLLFVVLLLAAAPAYAGPGCSQADLIGLGINNIQAEALGCDSYGSALVPDTDDTYDLGSSSYEWQDGYFDGTVNADGVTNVGTLSQTGNISVVTTDTGIVASTDAVTLKVCGGTDDATANGAFLTLDGDDKGGADTGAGAVLNVGNNTSAKLSVVHNATEVFAVNSSGVTVGDAALLRKDVGTVAAAGTACSGGGSIVDQVTYVSASDNTKAVMLPAGAATMVGATYTIYNTVASKMLNVCPGTSGNINAVGANTAVPIYGISGIDCTYLTTNTWSCSKKDAAKVRTIYIPAMLATAGTTAGWVVGTANLGEVTLPASQTASTLVLPVPSLELGDTIVSYKVIAQIESAGGAVTLDADLRQLTNAAADPSDASLGTITQVAVTADTAVASSKTLATPELVVTGESNYVLFAGTTAGSTDIRLLGVEVVIWGEN